MASFNYTTAKSLYSTYATARGNAITIKQSINALGPRPILPAYVSNQTEYNTTVAAQATWDSSYASLNADFQAALAAMSAAATAYIAATILNEWIKYTGLTPLDPVWVGTNGKDTDSNGILAIAVADSDPIVPFSQSTTVNANFYP